MNYLNEVSQIRHRFISNQSSWIFGTELATALDAHLIVFLVRLMDLGRDDLMPGVMREYAQRAMSMDLWKDFMQGRKTIYGYPNG